MTPAHARVAEAAEAHTAPAWPASFAGGLSDADACVGIHFNQSRIRLDAVDGATMSHSKTHSTSDAPARIPRCSRTLASLIAMGIQGANSYEPDQALEAVGSHMQPHERQACESFLRWLAQHGRAVERATVQAVWQEWKIEVEGKAGFARVLTDRPLSATTQQRIARGIAKHGLTAAPGRTGQLQFHVASGGARHG